jgi:signal transduction histidine kinase
VRFELAQIATGLPFAASIAAAATGGALRAGRRRAALNEALHELRRPLQALALAPLTENGGWRGFDSSLLMVAVALERLEDEVNGKPASLRLAPLWVRPVIDAAAGRWRRRAVLAGGSLRVRWQAREPVLRGDGDAISRVLDNLITNALEHGGPHVLLEIGEGERCLRIAVRDSGRASRPSSCRESAAEPVARLCRRRRRGQGLRIVRRIAAAHGGEFRFGCSERGGEAVLELPLRGDGLERAA